ALVERAAGARQRFAPPLGLRGHGGALLLQRLAGTLRLREPRAELGYRRSLVLGVAAEALHHELCAAHGLGQPPALLIDGRHFLVERRPPLLELRPRAAQPRRFAAQARDRPA